jgi:hypothetical protein
MLSFPSVCRDLNRAVDEIKCGKGGEENYDLVDESATRVVATGGRVIGVRKADIAREQSPPATLRYPV